MDEDVRACASTGQRKKTAHAARSPGDQDILSVQGF
jgi:hypothetical protein